MHSSTVSDAPDTTTGAPAAESNSVAPLPTPQLKPAYASQSGYTGGGAGGGGTHTQVSSFEA